MSLDAESPVVVETGPAPTATVIWLHGLGADGHDFAPMVPELGMSAAVRFVFPHAPYRPVTLNNGYVMRAWYDIGMDRAGLTANEEHVRASAAYVHELIESERAGGIPGGRIVVAGFSQGGALALFAGMRCPIQLAGLVVLSAPLVVPERMAAERQAANAATPVFLAHGAEDPIVPFPVGEATRTRLAALGANVEWHRYPIPHTVSMEEVADIAAFLARVLPA